MVAIGATEGDMHRHIEAEKALAAFRRSPDDGKAALRDDTFDQIVRLGADLICSNGVSVKRGAACSRRRLAVAYGLPVALAGLGDALCGELGRRQLLDVLPHPRLCARLQTNR